MNHSYEEIRSVAIDILAGREVATREPSQYHSLLIEVAAVFSRRDPPERQIPGQPWRGSSEPYLSDQDQELFLEVFWGLFREGVITLGLNNLNRNFPFFRVSEFGSRLLSQRDAYFFHDVSSFEKILRSEVPDIDETTVMYLKEAMQAFRSGCILSATVMLGVATEDVFLSLIEVIESNDKYKQVFSGVGQLRSVLQKVNKFKNVLDQQINTLPSDIKEDLDTNFTGILSVIRNFRNQSGHPTGKIVDREQVYVLLNLFIPYCKKMYALIHHFS